MHARLDFVSRELKDETGNEKAEKEKTEGKKNTKNNEHEEGTMYERHGLKNIYTL